MNKTIVYNGLTGSPGIAIGPVCIFNPKPINIIKDSELSPERELDRLNAAIETAKEQLVSLEEQTKKKLGDQEAQIFNVHQMFLSDPELINKIKETVVQDKVSAEYAVQQGIDLYSEKLLTLDSEYFRERVQDLKDIGKRLQNNLAGAGPENGFNPAEPSILLACDLTPSDTVSFTTDKLLGICTVKGGPTSHTAILARSLRIPALVSTPVDLETIDPSQTVILNADRGYIEINPTEEHIAHARGVINNQKKLWVEATGKAGHPAVSLDGQTVEVVANIGNKKDAEQALRLGAEGVGLFRTEFLYLDRTELPPQEEQVSVYAQIADLMSGKPIVIRTMDIGGDKEVAYLGIKDEANPFLGWRAIRMIEEKPQIFQDQIEAVLQGFAQSDLRIMVPMAASVEEVIRARQVIDRAVSALTEREVPFNKDFQFGIMVEVPSAALMIEQISPYVDFFSIGTNDLTQYTLAVDRTNEKVAALASPFHPAVIRLIARTIADAHRCGKWVGLCGEMAGDPLATPLLLGLGLDEFSMAPASIPIVKQRIRSLDTTSCKAMLADIMSLATTHEIIDYLRKSLP